MLAAVVRAIEQEPANEVCFVVPAGELSSGEAPTGADRLLACKEFSDAGVVMTLMLHHEM